MGQNQILKNTYGNSVNNISRNQDELDNEAKIAQSKMPLWKQYAQKAIESGVDGLQGFLGIGKETQSNLAGQLLSAGLPFTSIMKNKNVYHGTGKIFDKFDELKNDTADVLGWMTHFAENPKYASTYANGLKNNLNQNANIIIARPEAQNVLDLVNPNIDDLSQVLSNLDPIKRKEYINFFKSYRNVPEQAIKNIVQSSHVQNLGNELMTPGSGTRMLAEKIRLTPEEFNKTPFDGIRYLDNTERSFAFPSKTPIRSAYGNQLLNNPPKQIQVIRQQ